MGLGQTKVKVRFKVRVGVRGVWVRLRSCVISMPMKVFTKIKV